MKMVTWYGSRQRQICKNGRKQISNKRFQIEKYNKKRKKFKKRRNNQKRIRVMA